MSSEPTTQNEDFLSRLESEFPPSKLIDEKLGLYAWRFDDDSMAKIVAMSAALPPQADGETESQQIDSNSMAMINEALALSLGDSEGPRCNTERGRRFIGRTPITTRMEWATIIFDHCEINGPNADRKKK